MGADQAAGIAASGAGLLAEAGGVAAVAEGELCAFEQLVAVQVGELDLCGGDEVEALGGLEEVLFELGQLAGAGEGVLVSQGGDPELGGAAVQVDVEHVVDEGALEAGTLALQHREAAVGQLDAALEVDDAQLGAEVPVRLEVEVELAGGAPAADLGVVIFAGAHRGLLGAHVGHAHGQGLELGVDFGLLCVELGDLVAHQAHGLLLGLCLLLLAGLHPGTDLLGGGIALGLEGLDLADDLAALGVCVEEDVDVPLVVAVLAVFRDLLGVFADKANVEHDSSSLFAWCCRFCVASIALAGRKACWSSVCGTIRKISACGSGPWGTAARTQRNAHVGFPQQPAGRHHPQWALR